MALLQGAMLQALSLGDVAFFDEATEGFASQTRHNDAGPAPQSCCARDPLF